VDASGGERDGLGGPGARRPQRAQLDQHDERLGPADAAGRRRAEIDARTVNGGIGCDFDLSNETKAHRRLEGRIGAGGGRFELRTVNGAVNIDRGLATKSAARQPAEAAPADTR
jgi:hypothetical protein